MDFYRDNRVLKAQVEGMLAQVSTTCEGWKAYQRSKQRLREMMGQPDSEEAEEQREAALSDYEIAIMVAAYYSGLQDGFRQSSELAGEGYVQRILDTLSTDRGFAL